MYASSKIRNPNSAFYDFRYDSQEDAGGLFVSADMLGGGGKRKRLVGESDASNFMDTALYVTVQGLEDRNVFTMLTTFGNTCKCTSYSYQWVQLRSLSVYSQRKGGGTCVISHMAMECVAYNVYSTLLLTLL